MLAALSTPDTIVAIICAVAAVRGAVKGFAWQVVRTIGLVGALWGAFAWNERFGAWIRDTVPFVPDVASDWVALFVIFLSLLLIATWFAWMAKGALRTVKLGGIDRLLGFVAGAAMGLILVTAGFLAWGSWVRPETLRDTLENSLTVPYMTKVVEIVEPVLPQHLRDRWGEILHTLDDVVEPDGDG
jgi:uncharacterized membrane protein required for colicin V production